MKRSHSPLGAASSQAVVNAVQPSSESREAAVLAEIEALQGERKAYLESKKGAINRELQEIAENQGKLEQIKQTEMKEQERLEGEIIQLGRQLNILNPLTVESGDPIFQSLPFPAEFSGIELDVSLEKGLVESEKRLYNLRMEKFVTLKGNLRFSKERLGQADQVMEQYTGRAEELHRQLGRLNQKIQGCAEEKVSADSKVVVAPSSSKKVKSAHPSGDPATKVALRIWGTRSSPRTDSSGDATSRSDSAASTP